MIRNLNREECFQFLKANTIGYVGCNDGYNTYIYPTGYYFDEKNIVCQSLPGSKIEIMRQNKRVCFQVNSNPGMSYYKTVMILGEYSEINDLNQRYNAIRYFVKEMIHLDTFQEQDTLIKPPKMIKPVIYRIIIDEITGMHN